MDGGERWRFADTVRLMVDLPAEGLRRGDLGAIVEVYDVPEFAYEVEFSDADGRTRALLALRPELLERVPPAPPEDER